MGTKKNLLYVLVATLLLLQIFVYRNVIFGESIAFPSNFLVQFYSPWSTMTFPGWEAGIPHKPIGVDQFRFFYPARIFTNESFKHFTIPLWNPYIFSGNPHVADFQSAVFYPLSVLYAFLPIMTAWSMLIIIEPFLGLVGMYFYLRRLNLDSLPALLGAIAFGFSGFITVWSQENMAVSHAALWFPFILWVLESFLQSEKFRYFFAGILFLAMSFLAGFLQVTFYIFVFAFVYALVRIITSSKKQLLRKIILVIGMFALSLLLSAVQLLPSIEGFYISPRTTSNVWYLFESYLLPVTHVVNIFIPDIFGSPGSYNFFGRGFYHETVLYIGVIPLIFVFMSLKNIKKSLLIKFFALSALVTFFLTISSPLTQFFYRLPIPLISTFLPSRILILTTFSLSVLAGFGMQEFLKEKKFPKIIMVILSFFIVISIVIIVFALYLKFGFINNNITSYVIRPEFVWEEKYFSVIIRNIIFQLGFVFAFIVILVFYRFKQPFAFIVIFLTLVGQFYYLQKYVVIGHKEFVYPPHPTFSFLREHTQDTSRFITLGKPIVGNISTVEKIYSSEGLDPIFSNRYGLLTHAAKHEGLLSYNISRIEVNLSEIDEKKVFLKKSPYLKSINLLGIKYVLYHPLTEQESIEVTKLFPPEFFTPVKRINNWFIFENKNVLPRTYLASKFILLEDEQKILDTILNEKTDLKRTIVVEENPEKTLKEGTGSAKIDSYLPQKVIIKTTSTEEALLFLSDTYYPGWKAFVDGSETKIFRANFAFRGVFVPSGNHIVTFSYEPASFRYGYLLTITSLIVLSILFFGNSIMPLL